ncbi:MAG TPA: hypothetical protein VL500_00850 [Candidatus Eisenbacteria bacterium]|nr:hypothetical protein [Candidatus Eisenbacteria bacterium]
MDSCRYCGGGGAHDPGCPAAMAAAPDASADRRKFSEVPVWIRASGRADRCAMCRGTGEHAEDCPLADPDAPDFSNIDLLDRAMAYGDTEWLEKVRDYCGQNGMSDAEIDRSIESQRLRRETHQAMREELEARLRNDPEPTPAELSQGAFMEMIEPQAREAMREMRRKGYATASSGFNSLDAQSMELSSPDLLDLTADEVAALEAAGVRLSRGRRGFSFRVRKADLDQIKAMWNEVVALLPDLGRQAPDTAHPAARQFRKKYGPKAV